MTLGQTNDSGKVRISGTLVETVLLLFARFVFSVNQYHLLRLLVIWEFRKRVHGTEWDLNAGFALIYAYSLSSILASSGSPCLANSVMYVALVTCRISEGFLDILATVERVYGVIKEKMLVT